MSDHLPVSLEFAVGGTINVDEIGSNVKLIYNNNRKELSLFSSEEINSLNLLLFDVNGRVVKVESLRDIKESNWSLQYLPKGFYIASLKFNNQIKNLKFVIN